MTSICPECGIVYNDGKRHLRGYRVKNKHGQIVYTKRCDRQHIRKHDKMRKKGISSGSGTPFSQGY